MRSRISVIAFGALVLSAGLALAQPPAPSAPNAAADPVLQPKTTGATAPQPLLRLKSSFFKGQMVSFGNEDYTPAFKGDRLETTLATVPGAAEEFRSARTTHQAGLVLGGVGGAALGFAVGYGLTREAGWENPQTIMAAGGGALILVGAVIDASANRKLQRAVDNYNLNAPRPISLQLSPIRVGRSAGARVSVSAAF